MTQTPHLSLRWIAALLVVLAMMAAACTAAADEPFDSASGSEDGDGADGGGGGGVEPPADPNCNSDNARPSRAPGEFATALPQPGNMPAGSYMETIQDQGVLRIGVAQDTLLFGFLNTKTGEIEGFDVEIGKLVAEAIFGDPERVELVPIQSSERIPGLIDGRFDIVVKTMTITCQRWGSIDFSAVYFESGQKVLVREGEEEDITQMDPETRLCAASGTTSLDAIEAAGVTPVAVGGWTDCLVLFQQGKIDGISTDDTILAGLAAQDEFAKVSEGEPFSEEPYGIGSPKGHPEFTRFINAVLEEALADGTWLALYDEWLRSTLSDPLIPQPAYR